MSSTDKKLDDILTHPFLAVNDPAGVIELNVHLPSTIANAYKILLTRKDPESELLQVCAKKLAAIAHYTACSQLFSAIDDEQRSLLYHFSAVIQDEYSIPSHMSHATSIIGNFQLEEGNMIIDRPEILFKRWMVAGLTMDPDSTASNLAGWPVTCDEAYKCVWNDASSKRMIDELCLRYIKSCRKPFSVTLNTGEDALVTVSIPTIENIDSWRISIPRKAPFADSLISVGKLIAISITDWISCSYDREQVQIALKTINCMLITVSEESIIEEFTKAKSSFKAGELKLQLDKLFVMKRHMPRPSGTDAQLVSSDINSAEWSVPISNEEAILGFMLNPCDRLAFNPCLKAYSTIKAEAAITRYFKQGMR